MIELLKLFGFKEQELESELPRVEKAFQKLGINAEDIERGKERLRKYYDIELEGLRRVFRLCLRELVGIMLAREEGKKKVIYGFMAPGIDMIGSALVSKSREVLCVHQCWAYQVVVGCIFDKIVPVLEAAEEKWLKAGVVAHCANVKNIAGLFALDLLPRPDLLVTTGFTCETSPKTIDLIHELYGIPVYVADTCHDRERNEYPEPVERTVELTANNLRGMAGRVQEVAGLEITNDMLDEVMEAKGKLGDALHRLRDIVENSDPLVLSPAHENIWMCLGSLTLTIDDIAEAAAAINMLCDELQERVDKGLGVVEKGAPRVVAILPAGQTDPRLEYLACEVGIAIVAIDMGFEGVPFKTTAEDPYMKSALGSGQHTLGLPLLKRIPLIIDGCRKLKVDGVFDRFHSGCRAVVADALIIEEAVKKELGIPVLVLEWENFDPRVYNHEEYKRRLEVFKAMMTQSSG